MHDREYRLEKIRMIRSIFLRRVKPSTTAGSISTSESDISISTKYSNKMGCCTRITNVSRIKGRKVQMVQMIVLCFIPIFALIAQNLIRLKDVLDYQTEVTDIDRQVENTLNLGKFVTEIQNERSFVSFFVFTDRYIGSNLSERFAKTDEALENITSWPSNLRDLSLETKIFESKLRFQIKLEDFRDQISPEESSITQVMDYYTNINKIMLEYLSNEIKETNNSHVWRYLISYKNLLKSVENVGVSIVYGINYFGRGSLSQVNYIKFVKHDTLGTEYLNNSLEFANIAKEYYKNMTDRLKGYGQFQNMKNQILLNKNQTSNIEEAVQYFDDMVSYIEELRGMQKQLRFTIRYAIEERVRDAQASKILSMFIVILVLLLSPIIIFLVHKTTSTIQMIAFNLSVKAEELKKEKIKCERLLFQMLPKSVATQLKHKKQVQAQYYDQVTIYFSDIVGFTEISSQSSPLEVVQFLNAIYKQFDARIERYDVYKVETIGDSYMVASGIESFGTAGCQHVSEIACMALDLLSAAVIFQIPHRPGDRLQIRAGIHTGPCVAGIVGTRMPRYCLFGDSVNVASRMETTGLPQKIQISFEMKTCLDALGGFVIEHRGLTEVKGKGLLDTFFLCGKEGGLSRSVEFQETPGFLDNTSCNPDFMSDVENVDQD